MAELIENLSVSSVMNRDVKNFGKKNIFDGNAETCWHSAEGKSQWLKIALKEPMVINGFDIQFQGGFAGKLCCFKNVDCESESEQFFPEDSNANQTFKLSSSFKGKNFMFHFDSSTDFFGRIIIYKVSFHFEDK